MQLLKNTLMAVATTFVVTCAFAKDFYVDAWKGKDEYSGVTTSLPWKTLAKVNGYSFQPGDRIFFRTAQVFAGTLVISGSGKLSKPIVYSTYGGNAPAIIDGQGDSAAIYSYNREYIELRNLAVTNFRKGKMTINDLFNGIYIVNEDAGVLHHFYFDKIRVFNVNSTYIAKDEGKTDQSRFHGGVQFRTIGNKVRSHFDDVLITNSVFENLSRTGFNFRSDWDDRSAYSKFGDSIARGAVDNWTPNTRVVLRKNQFRNIAGNGLIVRVAVHALIEHNFFDSCGKIISGNATFNFNTDSTIYQYNEAQHTIYEEGETDARGIDSDYRTKHTIIQFNYLHDNEQGGICAVGGPGVGDDPINFNLGTIIRYNILENNLRQGMYFSGRVEGLEVYNNIIYASKKIDSVVALRLNRWTVYPNGAAFRNNIFYFEGKGMKYEFTNATNVSFDHNIYFGIQPPAEFKDPSPYSVNPLLTAPGKGKPGYTLLKSSPAVKKGVVIKGTAVKDFYGRPVISGAIPNIGIDNFRQ